MAVSVKSCGGGGLSSSDVTASSNQVLAGYTALTTDSNDEAMNGAIATWNGELCLPETLCFTANAPNSTVAMGGYGTVTKSVSLQTSVDNGVSWQQFVPRTTTITLNNIGDKVYFKGTCPNGINQSEINYYSFVMTGLISASGNIMGLIDDGACELLTLPAPYCFCNLFKGCSVLTTPPELPATTLKYYCYSNMFKWCSSLLVAPNLPATSTQNDCYTSMFRGCSSLITPPGLSHITNSSISDNAFALMFADCTSLTYVPNILADTLQTHYCGEDCYYEMFQGCTALYISDSATVDAPYAWEIRNTLYYPKHENFAQGCLGTRTSDDLYIGGSSNKIYYTQHPPIS